MQRDVKIGIAIGVLLIALIAIFWWARDETPARAPAAQRLLSERELPPIQEPTTPVSLGPPSVQPDVEPPATRRAVEPGTGSVSTERAPVPPAAPVVIRPTRPAVAPPSAPTSKPKTYKVQRGDSLYSIAQRFYGDGSKWTVIRDANKDRISRTDALKIGAELLIPEVSQRRTVVPAAIPAAPGQKTHTVAKGETLSSIAQKYYGSQAKSTLIYNANRAQLKNPDYIREGMNLVIPPE